MPVSQHRGQHDSVMVTCEIFLKHTLISASKMTSLGGANTYRDLVVPDAAPFFGKELNGSFCDFRNEVLKSLLKTLPIQAGICLSYQLSRGVGFCSPVHIVTLKCEELYAERMFSTYIIPPILEIRQLLVPN